MLKIKGLSEIALNYDAMLIDQFGVIHNGQELYAGAAEVLAKLHDLKIPVIVMTNSGKRAAANVARLLAMGVPRAHFVQTVSSGEVAAESIGACRAFIIGKSGEDYGFEKIEPVSNPAEAEILLILGSNAPLTTMEDYRRLLVNFNVPAICCNPDKYMLTSQGLQPAPGMIATEYEKLGNHVTWIGKPYPSIYQHALKIQGNPKRVLCIGDSAEHDVAGGIAAGLHTLLIRQGVSADLDLTKVAPQPHFTCDKFCW